MRTKIWASVAAGAVLTTVVFLSAAARVETVEGLTGRDVGEIRSKVRRDLWRVWFLPNGSLQSLAKVTGNLRVASRTEITKPLPCGNDGGVSVGIFDKAKPHEAVTYHLVKTNGHWIIVWRVRYYMGSTGQPANKALETTEFCSCVLPLGFCLTMLTPSVSQLDRWTASRTRT